MYVYDYCDIVVLCLANKKIFYYQKLIQKKYLENKRWIIYQNFKFFYDLIQKHFIFVCKTEQKKQYNLLSVTNILKQLSHNINLLVNMI